MLTLVSRDHYWTAIIGTFVEKIGLIMWEIHYMRKKATTDAVKAFSYTLSSSRVKIKKKILMKNMAI